jgi:CheY-like chemotaxis protein
MSSVETVSAKWALEIVTVAPGTTAPEGSVTVPEIEPAELALWVVCANPTEPAITTASASEASFNLLVIFCSLVFLAALLFAAISEYPPRLPSPIPTDGDFEERRAGSVVHAAMTSGFIRALNPKRLVCWPATLSPILELMNGLKTIERASVRVKVATKMARHWLVRARANSKATSAATKAALVITAEPEVGEALRQSLSPDWRLIPADTLYQAIEIISREKITIVFCDREIRALDWRKAVSVLSNPPFRACVIVLSGFVGRNSWEEVAELGGYEVLPKPLVTDKVLRVAKAAWSHWRSQQALRAWYQSSQREREPR